ncbi:hypothetical protein [Pseudodesulfovibrio sp.]|uniref:hypothetical protein n=1 Tax=unclassified Pseudodesulfovibrio TaxID=2661612 RepID=UPI003AFFDE69
MPSIHIQLPADAAWAGLMQAAAEQGGAVFGLDPSKRMRLVQCAEELLLFLAAAEVGEIETTIRPIATGVEIGCSFASAGVNLSALNFVSAPSGEDDGDWTSLPLLLASRMTDGFRVGLEARRMEMVFRVDKAYPEPDFFPAKRVSVQGKPIFAEAGDAGLLLEACSSIKGFYPMHVVPEWCSSPGRTADLVRAGELSALAARDSGDRLCGIIFWRMRSEQSVTFFGPYDFSSDGTMAGELITAMLRQVGRTRARTIFSSLATEPLDVHGFEKLAELPYQLEGQAEPVVHPVWGRMLQEDFGAAVWTQDALTDFLRDRYDSLELMRDLRPVSDLGEAVPSGSVIGVRLVPALSEVFLHPELNGADMGDNIARHVSSLASAGYKNIFFEIDLGKGWHVAMGEPLLQCGFRPELLLPHGGQADTLIFRYASES